MYKCSKCNLSVVVLSTGEQIKACKCNAAIVAELKATVYSASKLKS